MSLHSGPFTYNKLEPFNRSPVGMGNTDVATESPRHYRSQGKSRSSKGNPHRMQELIRREFRRRGHKGTIRAVIHKECGANVTLIGAWETDLRFTGRSGKGVENGERKWGKGSEVNNRKKKGKWDRFIIPSAILAV